MEEILTPVNIENIPPSFETENEDDTEISKSKTLDSNHPLMIKYQNELKERLVKLLEQTDDHLTNLARAVNDQDKENEAFALRGYEVQKALKNQDEKLKNLLVKHDRKVLDNNKQYEKFKIVEEKFKKVETIWKNELIRDLELQAKLEEVSLGVVQLTLMQIETEGDAKNVKYSTEKTIKERGDLETEKLRQDLLLFRLENDKFKLEDKLNLFKAQCGIKKEEAKDLQKELIAAKSEIEIINLERTQIVHQWQQSLTALEKQDRVLSDIRDSFRQFEDKEQTHNLDIAGIKKSIRKELERNEQLFFKMRLCDADIAQIQKSIKENKEQEINLDNNLSILKKTANITEQELSCVNENNFSKMKELEEKDREMEKTNLNFKLFEEKHMNHLHEKITFTKASKYANRLIESTRKEIQLNEEKISKKENEKTKLLLKTENLKCYLTKIRNEFHCLDKEREERDILLKRSEADIVKNRKTIFTKHGDIKELNRLLEEMINQAGGEELAPFERELANLMKEISVTNQGKKNMEQEYLRSQHELFSLIKNGTIKADENEHNHKKIVILEGKKIQTNADIIKEENEIKNIHNRIKKIKNETITICKLLYERKEDQDHLQEELTLSKCDLIQTLKEAELKYLQKQNEIRSLQRKKKRKMLKLLEIQRKIVYWEGKIHLVDTTQKILKSQTLLEEFSVLKGVIRQLQIKQDKIIKEQKFLLQEMSKSVQKHAVLYVEADKQVLFGHRKKTPQYVEKRKKHLLRKTVRDKKILLKLTQEIYSLDFATSKLDSEWKSQNLYESDLRNQINMLEGNIDFKEGVKKQGFIMLSYKQKKVKFMQNILESTYIRAIRQENLRLMELQKLSDSLEAISIIIQATIKDYPFLKDLLLKTNYYFYVSKQL